MKNRSIYVLLALLAVQPAFATQHIPDERVFGEAQALREKAETAGAPFLAPESYEQGVKDYDRARADFSKGRDVQRVYKQVTASEDSFRRAIENTELARTTLKNPIASRTAADEAEAFKLAPSDWAEGERHFTYATRALEKGNLKAAQKYGKESEQYYQLAELNAIKGRHLAEARSLIIEADRLNAERYAPKTLNKASSLLDQAERGIEADRYDTAGPIELADEASYEARHAMYIARVGQQLRGGDMSIEDLILAWETPLAEAAAAAGIDADFSKGYAAAGAGLQQEVSTLKAQNDQMRTEIDERDRLVLSLEDELRDLDSRLGGATDERAQLVRRLEDQARTREQFAQVEQLFAPEEAIVLRDGSQLIIRLVGLNFPSGSAQIATDSQALLTKVEDAINIFPRSELMVEGHTDSYGGAEQNMRLSKNRAQSVVNYIVDKMRIPAYRVRAVGYGDTRPIANNKTAQGRAKNRRIDLIVTPEGGSPGS